MNRRRDYFAKEVVIKEIIASYCFIEVQGLHNL